MKATHVVEEEKADQKGAEIKKHRGIARADDQFQSSTRSLSSKEKPLAAKDDYEVKFLTSAGQGNGVLEAQQKLILDEFCKERPGYRCGNRSRFVVHRKNITGEGAHFKKARAALVQLLRL